MSTLKGVKKPLLRRPTKRTSIVLAALLCIAILLGVMWFLAANAWQSQADSAIRDQQSAIKARQTVLTSTNKANRQAALVKLADTNYAPDRCKGSWWYAWQQNVSEGAKTAKTGCDAANRTLEALNKASSDIKRYLEDEKSIQAQLSSLKINSAQKDWQVTAVSSASKALDSLKALKVSKPSEPLLIEATKRVESITKAWKLLNEANKKQDKAAYLAAMTALSDAYAGLAAVSDVSDEQVKLVIATLKNVE